MPDLDRSIYDQLHRQADEVQLAGGDVSAVMARGRGRRRRNRGAVSVLAVVAAAAVTGGILTRSGGGHTTVVRSGTDGPVPGATLPANAQLQWSAQPVANDLGYATSLAPGATQYALSTGPGVAGSEATALWSSTDGLSWQTVAGPKGVSLGDVSTNGGTVYMVGTGTATAATSDVLAGGVQVASSTDGGAAWQQVKLPLDFAAPAGALSMSDDIVKIAAGSGGVVAAVTPSASLDLSRVLPAGVTAGNWTTTPSGVDLLGTQRANACGPGQTTTPPGVNKVVGSDGAAVSAGTVEPTTVASTPVAPSAGGAVDATTTTVATPGNAALEAQEEELRAQGQGTATGRTTGPVTAVSCFTTSGTYARSLTAQQAYPVTGQYSWAQLGLGAEAVDAVRGEPIVFFSADGRHFSQVTLPAGGGAVESLNTDGSGFVMATNNYVGGVPTVFRSPDGRHWTAYPLLADTGVTGVGTAGGRLLAVAQTATGSQVLELQGATWVPLAVPGLAVPADENPQQNVTGVAFGPLGVAIGVQDFNGTTSDSQVLYSPDGTTWSSSDLATLSGGPVEQIANLAVDANRVVVTVERPATTAGGITAGTKVSEVAVVGTVKGS